MATYAALPFRSTESVTTGPPSYPGDSHERTRQSPAIGRNRRVEVFGHLHHREEGAVDTACPVDLHDEPAAGQDSDIRLQRWFERLPRPGQRRKVRCRNAKRRDRPGTWRPVFTVVLRSLRAEQNRHERDGLPRYASISRLEAHAATAWSRPGRGRQKLGLVELGRRGHRHPSGRWLGREVRSLVQLASAVHGTAREPAPDVGGGIVSDGHAKWSSA